MTIRLQTAVRKGQIYKSVSSKMIVEVFGMSGSKYKTRVLTDKPGVYAGTHTLSRKSIATRFKLIS